MEETPFFKTEDINGLIKPQSLITLITKGGAEKQFTCSMSPEDFLRVYNRHERIITIADGAGSYCRIAKPQVALLNVSPIDDSPFDEYNNK